MGLFLFVRSFVLRLGDDEMAGVACIRDQFVSRVHADGRGDRVLETVSVYMVCEERA